MKIQFPQTNLEDLLEYYESIKQIERLTLARLEAGAISKKEAYDTLNIKTSVLSVEYIPRLKYQDFHMFFNLKEAGHFLKKAGWFSTEEIRESIDHEKAHTKMAEHLGYSIDGYSCWLYCKKDNEPGYLLSTRVKAYALPDIEKYRKIALAPKDRSIFDIV